MSKGDGLYVLHEARHTTATLLLAAGVDEAVITAIMGHSDYATTQTYLHAPTELLSRALDRVAEQLQLASADEADRGGTGSLADVDGEALPET